MSADKKPRVEAAGDDGSRGDIPESVRASFHTFNKFKEEIQDIEHEAIEKVLEIQEKYHEMKKALYKKRNEIIQSLPEFWLNALLSHPTLIDLISEEDKKILNYLVNLEVESSGVDSGFYIILKFSPNPYFEDRSLVKEYSFDDHGNARICSSQIRWKEGKNIANGGSEGKKGGKRTMPEKSFFSWFNESKQEVIAEWHTDKVGKIIKEELWTNPLKYFDDGKYEEADFYEDEEVIEEDGNEEEKDDDNDDD